MGLMVGSVLAALAVYRLLGGFGTLLISLAVSGFVVAKLEPKQPPLGAQCCPCKHRRGIATCL